MPSYESCPVEFFSNAGLYAERYDVICRLSCANSRRISVSVCRTYFGSCFDGTVAYAGHHLTLLCIDGYILCYAVTGHVSAMVSLEEADEKTAAYLFVTPLGRNGYLAARFCIPSAAAFLITLALLPVFKLTSLSPADIVLLAAGGALQGIIISLLILTFSSNKLEGMAVTKLSTLMILGAVIPFFVKHNIQYVVSPLPSFWIGKAILENMLIYMLPAFVLSAVWICFLLKRYLRKI